MIVFVFAIGDCFSDCSFCCCFRYRVESLYDCVRACDRELFFGLCLLLLFSLSRRVVV